MKVIIKYRIICPFVNDRVMQVTELMHKKTKVTVKLKAEFNL